MPRAEVVAALAELRHLTDEEIAVVAPVHLMAGSAILRHRRVFEGKRPFLFRVAGVAEVRNGIGIEHMLAETAMGRMAIGAFDFPLGHGVAGLPV